MSLVRLRRFRTPVALAAVLTIAVVGTIQAHVLKDFGPYSVALGWAVEPTYVGQVNAVQVVVKDKAGKPVTDLAEGDLKVVVSVGGQDSSALSLTSKFDEDTGLGIAGDYETPLTPTAPGDYTFHLTGSIHGQAVDRATRRSTPRSRRPMSSSPTSCPRSPRSRRASIGSMRGYRPARRLVLRRHPRRRHRPPTPAWPTQ